MIRSSLLKKPLTIQEIISDFSIEELNISTDTRKIKKGEVFYQTVDSKRHQ